MGILKYVLRDRQTFVNCQTSQLILPNLSIGIVKIAISDCKNCRFLSVVVKICQIRSYQLSKLSRGISKLSLEIFKSFVRDCRNTIGDCQYCS